MYIYVYIVGLYNILGQMFFDCCILMIGIFCPTSSFIEEQGIENDFKINVWSSATDFLNHFIKDQIK